LPPSKTSELTGFRTDIGTRTKVSHNATTAIIPAPEITGAGTGNTVSTAKSRIIPKKNAERESKTLSRAKTNMDVPTGQKCM
jgi:hypothetical protein